MSSRVYELVADGVPGESNVPDNTLITEASSTLMAILITIPVVLCVIRINDLLFLNGRVL
jgi:hypothetical protein